MKQLKTSKKLLAAFVTMTGVSAFAATPEAVPGEYIVRFKKSTLTSMNKQQQLSSLKSYIKSEIPSQNIVVIKRPTFENAASVYKTIALNDAVDVIEPNYIYKINKLPNDPKIDLLWGLKNIGQKDSEGTMGVAGVDINVEKAWDIQTGSKKIIVAVIDTGVDYNHADLKENIWVNQAEQNGKPGVDDDENGVIDDIHGFNAINGSGNPMDDQGHGSHCAGTIGAKGDDGKGIVGVNWDVSIMGVKFLDANGSGTLENALKAIDYATKMGAHVQSNSWGGGGFSQTLFDAIKRSNEAGALFVAAAGNENNNNDGNPTYPASYDSPNIIAVAAIDNVGNKASFSSYGKRSVHLAAPGVNIYSSTGGAYDSWSGTSMATPHVSGVAALVWANEESLTALELKNRLVSTVKLIPSMRGKTRSGGMIDAFGALTNTLTPPDENDPVNWPTVDFSLASESPYPANTNVTYEVSAPEGTTQFAIYFQNFETEASYDTLQIFDSSGKLVQTLSGNNSESFSFPINGSKATLTFKSDSNVEKSGWIVTKLAVKK